MTVKELLSFGRDELLKVKIENHQIDNARLESEILLSDILKCDRSKFLTHDQDEVTDECKKIYSTYIKRRSQLEPVAYIVKKKSFYNSEFAVREGVLIPRPETELIVESALALLPPSKASILDLGCGTGCIGLSILKERKEDFLFAVDLSHEAVRVCAENAVNLQVSNRVQILQRDVSKLQVTQKFDCVVANPPYISKNDATVDWAVAKFEPELALYCDNEGLEKIKDWSVKAAEYLKPGGFWIFEVGHKQAQIAVDYVKELKTFSSVVAKKDLQNIDRVVIAMKN